jgi:phospho-N-acetylmuramoyl-pentapeptide-transferase
MIAVLIAGAVAMLVSLAATRGLISFFVRLGKGQPILGAEDHGPVHQMGKQGTPTMGGIAILLAAAVGWLAAHLRGGLPFSDQAAIIWLTVFVLAAIGFIDDYLKVKRQHNRGIFWKKKGWITFGITVLLLWLLASTTGVAETISFTRAMSPGWTIPGPFFVLWTALMVWSTTNAVNVTDGLDGLAAGSALFGFLAFTIIAYWAFRNPKIYDIVNPLDLAVLSAAFAGSSGGMPRPQKYLWAMWARWVLVLHSACLRLPPTRI